MSTPPRRTMRVALGLMALVGALACATAAIAALRIIHDILGPETEYLLGNDGYPCRALPPMPGLDPWLGAAALVSPLGAAAGVLVVLALRGIAGASSRPIPRRDSLVLAVQSGLLAGAAIVLVAIVVDYTFLWNQYAAAGPHGQTTMCPAANGDWHGGQLVLWALAIAAASASVALAFRAHRACSRRISGVA